MKYLKLYENFSEENTKKYPDSITVKLTDEWKNSHNLYHVPSQVDLLNNDETYTYIGNTKLDGYSGIIYFASRRDNLVFITGLDTSEKMSHDYDLKSLTDQYSKSKRAIENSGLRKFPSGTCTLGKLDEPDYSGELKVGMSDHRGYFEIVSIK
jgi:hypothetical protein